MRGREGRRTNPFDEVLENLDLDKRLVMEAFLVADDLDSNHITRLVIAALENLSERSLPENVNDLVAEHDVVVRDDEIVSAFVVVAEVVERDFLCCGLLVAVGADEVDLAVVEDFLLLVRGEVARVE